MTSDNKARAAIVCTWDFLLSLLDEEQTPGIPEEQRQQARTLMKHYPYPCCVPGFPLNDTLVSRTYDAMESIQDVADETPQLVNLLHLVLDLLTEFQGMMSDERRRTQTKTTAVVDGLPNH